MPISHLDLQQHDRQYSLRYHTQGARLPKEASPAQIDGHRRRVQLICVDFFVLVPHVLCLLATTSIVPKEEAHSIEIDSGLCLHTMSCVWLKLRFTIPVFTLRHRSSKESSIVLRYPGGRTELSNFSPCLMRQKSWSIHEAYRSHRLLRDFL